MLKALLNWLLSLLPSQRDFGAPDAMIPPLPPGGNVAVNMLPQAFLTLTAAELPASHPDARRSSHWPTVRKHFLEGKACAACGGTENLQVHHCEPFHISPGRELDNANLAVLCEHPGRNCHFVFGHGGRSWKNFNPHVREDAARWLARQKDIVRG